MQYGRGDLATVTDPGTHEKVKGRVCDVDEKDGSVCVIIKGSRVWVRGDCVRRAAK